MGRFVIQKSLWGGLRFYRWTRLIDWIGAYALDDHLLAGLIDTISGVYCSVYLGSGLSAGMSEALALCYFNVLRQSILSYSSIKFF